MPSFAIGKELAGLGGVLNRFIAAPATGAALFNQGRSGSTLDKTLKAIPSTKDTDMGRAAWNELQYIGSRLQQGRTPYAKVGSIPPSANGESYRRAELRLADAARSGGGGGGGGNAGYSVAGSTTSSFSPAAERAYQQEVSRVAQLTAQDPELQRYEKARKEAVAAGPGSAAEQSAEDMGMQMWAKANPKLAAKVKPGQSGYDAIQRMQGVGQMGSPLNLPFDTSSPLGTTPPISPASYDAGKVAQGLGLSTVPRNAFAGASAAPYAGFSQGPTLQSAPLGVPSEMPSASYAGATGIQPMGSAVDKFDPKGLEAQKLLEIFKDSIFTTQK
jgi:hypothetical protein